MTVTANHANELCFVGIGANLGDPVAQVEQAIHAIAALDDCELKAVSKFYKSPPLEYPGIDDAQRQLFYVNAVVAFETAQEPESLLDQLQAIEQTAGRDRDSQNHQWAARPLDLDILAFGQRQIDSARLSIPHPRISERSFVLLPLCDIAPSLMLPNLDRSNVLLNNCALDGIEQLGSGGIFDQFAIEID